jgi:hypothetical protein
VPTEQAWINGLHGKMPIDVLLTQTAPITIHTKRFGAMIPNPFLLNRSMQLEKATGGAGVDSDEDVR